MNYKFLNSIIKGLFSLVFVFLMIENIKAQSDYEITEQFRETYANFEKSIDTVNSPGKLVDLKRQILGFKEKYSIHKALLDKALYPDNFTSTFENLNKKFELTLQRVKSAQELHGEVVAAKEKIVHLEDELTGLSNDIKDLKSERIVLLSEIEHLKTRPLIDKNTIDSLKRYISLLRSNISKRDTLIMQVIDSVFITHINRVSELDDKEKKKISVRIKSSNLLENLKALIVDNIYYVNSSDVDNIDLAEFKREHYNFKSKWQSLGKSLTAIYSEQKYRQEELIEINGLLEDWDRTINEKIWDSINRLFKDANIKIDSFYSGDDFYNSVLAYVNKQLDTLKEDPDYNGSDVYKNFAENVWKTKVTPVWTPLLIKYNLLSNEQFESLEAAIKSWSLEVETPLKIWLYIGIAVIFIFFTIIFINYATKKSKEKDYD